MAFRIASLATSGVVVQNLPRSHETERDKQTRMREFGESNQVRAGDAISSAKASVVEVSRLSFEGRCFHRNGGQR